MNVLQEEYEPQLEVKIRTVQYYVSKKRKELYEEKVKRIYPSRAFSRRSSNRFFANFSTMIMQIP